MITIRIARERVAFLDCANVPSTSPSQADMPDRSATHLALAAGAAALRGLPRPADERRRRVHIAKHAAITGNQPARLIPFSSAAIAFAMSPSFAYARPSR